MAVRIENSAVSSRVEAQYAAQQANRQAEAQSARQAESTARDQVAQAQREPVNTQPPQRAVGNIIDVVA